MDVSYDKVLLSDNQFVLQKKTELLINQAGWTFFSDKLKSLISSNPMDLKLEVTRKEVTCQTNLEDKSLSQAQIRLVKHY